MSYDGAINSIDSSLTDGPWTFYLVGRELPTTREDGTPTLRHSTKRVLSASDIKLHPFYGLSPTQVFYAHSKVKCKLEDIAGCCDGDLFIKPIEICHGVYELLVAVRDRNNYHQIEDVMGRHFVDMTDDFPEDLVETMGDRDLRIAAERAGIRIF